jgi:4-diphosphocytidyl-2-C-methyl-D-erythritol kinase
VFCTIDLADELELRAGPPGIRLEVTGAELGPPEHNLAYRAAVAFFRATGSEPALSIRLEKRIPAGAGLGGGSSDAAATLRALNELHGRPLDEQALMRLGASLGSDVPYFVTGAALALVWGRGERVLPLPPPPRAPVLLAIPPFAIATAEAYRVLDHQRGSAPAPRQIRLEDLSTWDGLAATAANDFEPVIFRAHPELARLRDALEALGARPARLTGSGSTVFGIFGSGAQRRAAAAELGRVFPHVRLIESFTAAASASTPVG